MDLTTALAMDLDTFTAVLDQGPRHRADLTWSLRTLTHVSVTAVHSFLGLSITVTTDGQDVTLTSVAEGTVPADVRSTLRMPLDIVVEGVSGSVLFYAGRAGALDRLAAELRSTLGSDAGIRLDELGPEDLSVAALVSGISGAHELSVINRAVGVLIARGRSAAQARAELTDQAAREQVTLPAVAERLLRATSAEGC